MPIYQYECASCGTFDVMRSIADRDQRHVCPQCGAQTSRVMTGSAMLSLMPQSQRAAFAVNERNAHSPASSKTDGHRHGPGCGCGKQRAATRDKERPNVKASPGRPWMISH
jgi:putative FmdB family regulatory protein